MFDRTDERFLSFRIFVEEKLESLIEADVENGVLLDEAIERAEGQLFDRLSNSETVLPDFENGFLPATLRCSLAEFESRFGGTSERRRQLMETFTYLFSLAQTASAARIMIGGSFIDDVRDPEDIDVVILIERHTLRSQRGAELWELYLRNETAVRGIDLKLEADEAGWWGWYRLLGKLRPPFPGYRGLVEVML